LDIARDYSKIHPVFNISLVVRYNNPREVQGRGTVQGIREFYYKEGRVVDWSKLAMILDARQVSKGKFDYLLRWRNSTPGEDTWVADRHIPRHLQGYLDAFRANLVALYKSKKKGYDRQGIFVTSRHNAQQNSKNIYENDFS
jgi:hypothetical protein